MPVAEVATETTNWLLGGGFASIGALGFFGFRTMGRKIDDVKTELKTLNGSCRVSADSIIGIKAKCGERHP